MNMRKCLWVVLFLVLFAISHCAFAAERPGKIYAHEGPDGTLSLVARDVHDPLFNKVAVIVELHKIIAPNKTYYALRTCVRKAKAQETPLVGASLYLDGKGYNLIPLAGSRKDVLLGATQEWFEITDDLLDGMTNAKKITVTIQYSNGKTRTDEVGKSFVSSLQQLPALTKDNYQQQDNIKFLNNDYTIFIPNVKPAELAAALIYNVNYEPLSGKDKLQSYYYLVAKSQDYGYLAFYNDISRLDKTYFCGWLTLQPQGDGTWVSLDLLNTYSRSWCPMEPKGDSGLMKLYRASDLVESILKAYQSFYGTYDYGFNWEPVVSERDSKNVTRSKWRLGPFAVTNMNTASFPALAQIGKGDIVAEINGMPTKNMNYFDTLFKTVYFGGPVTFTMRDAAGNQKVILVHPKFTPAEGERKNYAEIIAKDSRQFTKLKESDNPFDVPMSYNPLGSGLQ